VLDKTFSVNVDNGTMLIYYNFADLDFEDLLINDILGDFYLTSDPMTPCDCKTPEGSSTTKVVVDVLSPFISMHTTVFNICVSIINESAF
jgi:hypothetical protein